MTQHALALLLFLTGCRNSSGESDESLLLTCERGLASQPAPVFDSTATRYPCEPLAVESPPFAPIVPFYAGTAASGDIVVLENLRVPLDFRARRVTEDKPVDFAVLQPVSASVEPDDIEYIWGGETLPGYNLGKLTAVAFRSENQPAGLRSVRVQLSRENDFSAADVLTQTDCSTAEEAAIATIRPLVLQASFSDADGFSVIVYGYSQEFKLGNTGEDYLPLAFAGRSSIKQAEVRTYQKRTRGGFVSTMNVEGEGEIRLDLESCNNQTCTGSLERSGTASPVTAAPPPSPPYECGIVWE